MRKHKWTEEAVRIEATKYDTRWEFQKGVGSAYDAARKLGIMDELFGFVGNGNPREVYAYEFIKSKTVYVGLTGNIKQRSMNHNNKGPVFENRKLTGEAPKLVILTDKIDEQAAGKEEDIYIEKYQSEGWTLLNKHRGGHLGSILKQ